MRWIIRKGGGALPPFIRRVSKAFQPVQQQGSHLFGRLLLGPVADAGQHLRAAQTRQVRRHEVQRVYTRHHFERQVPIAADKQRRLRDQAFYLMRG